MRVKGPPGGAPPIDETSETTATNEAAPLAESRAVGEVGEAPAVGQNDRVAEVARRLRAGEISPQEAVEQLIDDAVDRQLGRVTTDRARLAAELKELLRRYTETDPYLASKVRRLGNRS